MVAVVNNLAAADLNILEFFVVKNHSGEHNERNVNLCFNAVDSYVLVLFVLVVKADTNLSALAL